MTEKLEPDDKQQERRAEKSKFLAELLDRELAGSNAEVTFKGEAVDITKDDQRVLTITSNADDTFTIDDENKRLSSSEIGSAIKARL